MAGGSGTRFWPASRQHHPKQFLNIGSDQSLIGQTVARVMSVVPPEQLWIVTGAAHAAHAHDAVPDIPPTNILVEPVGRNTAACIAWANAVILDRDPEAVLAVLPADHYIAEPEAFAAQLEAGFAAAARGRILLFGIVPTEPHTGYGYIQRGAPEPECEGRAVSAVRRFVEKPDQATALGYLKSGDYLWNSGMFMFPAGLMDQELRTHLPELAAGIDALMAAPPRLEELYPTLPAVSIDVGVMERSAACAVMPASFAWSDVGSWDAAAEVYAADDAGNVQLGDALLHDVRGCMVDARADRLVALVGVEGLIVVDSPDALLVVQRGRSQDVKAVVETLKRADRGPLL